MVEPAVNDAKDVPGMMRRLVGVLSDDEVAALQQRWSGGGGGRPSLRIATVCSGTDAPVLALQLIISALSERAVGGKGDIAMEHVFSCESVAFKRNFIEATTKPPLLFTDVTELATGRAQCHDGVERAVPEDFNVLIAGTECVDFSNLTTTPKGLKDGGRSAVTFWSTLDLAKAHKPPIVVLENVATCPAKEMEKAFEDVGYVAVHRKVCTSDYLLPQSRKRTYFLFVHAEKARFLSSKDDWIATMNRLGPNRPMLPKEVPLEWTDFLCDDNDAAAAVSANAKRPRGKPLSESLGSKWLAEIQKIETKEKLTSYDAPGGRPFTDATKESAALASLPDRAKMRLDVQCKRAIKAGIDPFTVPLLWNPAQQLRFTDAGFTDGTPRTIAPCVTPKHEWIVSSRKKSLSGPESLGLQGIPVAEDALREFDDKQLRDLAGNAMSTTVVAAACLACFLSCELIRSGGESSTSREKRSASDDGQNISKRLRA